MKFKKMVSLVLALAIMLGLLPTVALPVNATTGYDRGYTGGMAGTGEYKAFGLDVSSWQGIDLDFNRIKNAGYSYVILRAGTSKGKDTCFETYYTNAKAAGLDVGAYYYSYATSVAAVQADMNDFLSYIAGKTFEYPIYLDYEDASQQALSASLSQQICLTAMDMLAAEGYLVGMYTGKYFSTQIPMDVICAKYEVWIAHYLASGDGTYNGTGDYWKYGPTYASQYGMYQFTDSVWIEGYGPYDGDVCYKDYPSIVKAYGFNGYNEGKNPIGQIDSVTAEGPGRIRVRGWTLDEDALWTPLETHVYIGGGPGDANAEGHIITADQYREDIAAAYPNAGGYHGFDVVLNTGKSGWQVVNVFGINAGNGSNTLLTNSGWIADIPADTENPVISDVRVSDVSALGYTVTCTVSDNVAIRNVAMPTWTQAWEQDDTIWGEATISGNQATYNVSFSSHNFEYGTYNTHIYAYDLAGNYVCYPIIVDVPPVLSEKPVTGTVGANTYFIASVMNKNYVVDISAASTENDANAQLWFTVGTARNQMWQISDPDGDGYYSIISLHSGKALDAAGAGTTDGTNVQQYEINGTDAQLWKLEEIGEGVFRIVNKNSGLVLDLLSGTVANGQNIQLYTANDSWAQMWHLIPADLAGPAISDVQFSEVSTEGFRVTCTISDVSGIKKVQFPTWTKYNGTDDQIWYDATVSGNTATCYISTSDHNYAPGDYEVHIYAYDNLDNSSAVIGGEVTVPNRIGKAPVSGKLENGTYFITTSQNQNFVMDVEGVSTENSANVYLWETTGVNTNQMWQVSDPDGDGYYTVVAVHSGKYLDVAGGIAASDTNVQQYEATNSDAQLWQIVPNDDGTYCLYSKCGGFALDLFYGWVGNGVNIRIHDVNGAAAQKWYLIPANLSADTPHTHTYLTSVVTDPTCTEAGYTTHVCANCGASYVSDEVAALGHSYDSGTITTQPGCTTGGVKTYSCSKCGDSYTESVAANGHSHNTVVTAPTCTEKGYTTYTCSCGDSYVADEVAALGHSFANGTCTVCGTADPDYNPVVTPTLSADQKALVADYSASMIATVTQASGDKLGSFINDKTYIGRYPTISFEGAFCINYYFQPSLSVEGDVMMYVWSLEDYEAAEVLTKENATKAVKMELTESGEYLAAVDGIAAKDLDKAAYVSFVYSDGTTEHCGGVLGYTIGMYCKSQASKTGTLTELAKACAVYGYYAKQLFNK